MKTKEALGSHLTEDLREVSSYCAKRCGQDLDNGTGFVTSDSQLNGCILLRFPVFTVLLDTPTVVDLV